MIEKLQQRYDSQNRGIILVGEIFDKVNELVDKVNELEKSIK